MYNLINIVRNNYHASYRANTDLGILIVLTVYRYCPHDDLVIKMDTYWKKPLDLKFVLRNNP